MRSLLSWMTLFLCLATPSLAMADVFECKDVEGEWEDGDGKESVPYPLGKDKVLVVERCRMWAGHAYWEQRYVVSVWKDGRRLISQTVQEGIITDSGSSYSVDRDKQSIQISVGCGDVYSEDEAEQGAMCDSKWTWSERHQLLLPDKATAKAEEESGFAVSAQAMSDFDEALKAEDLTKAHALFEQVAGALGYEQNLHWVATQHQRYLEVARKKALALHKDKKKSEAAEIARAFFGNSGSESGVLGIELEDEYLGAERLRDRGFVPVKIGGEESKRFIGLPRDDRTTLIINDLAYFLIESDDLADVRLGVKPLLDLSQLQPERMVLHLNLGDALWRLYEAPASDGEREWAARLARYHYVEYIKKPTSRVAAKRAVARVKVLEKAAEESK